MLKTVIIAAIVMTNAIAMPAISKQSRESCRWVDTDI